MWLAAWEIEATEGGLNRLTGSYWNEALDWIVERWRRPSPGRPGRAGATIGSRTGVRIRRGLSRAHPERGDSTRRIEEVLAAHGLTPRGWAVSSADWTKRIRRDPDLRSKFQRLYVGPTVEPSAGNE